MVWLHLKISWLSKENFTGHSERGKMVNRRKEDEETILQVMSEQGWTLLALLGQLKTRLGGKGLL